MTSNRSHTVLIAWFFVWHFANTVLKPRYFLPIRLVLYQIGVFSCGVDSSYTGAIVMLCFLATFSMALIEFSRLSLLTPILVVSIWRNMFFYASSSCMSHFLLRFMCINESTIFAHIGLNSFRVKNIRSIASFLALMFSSFFLPCSIDLFKMSILTVE